MTKYDVIVLINERGIKKEEIREPLKSEFAYFSVVTTEKIKDQKRFNIIYESDIVRRIGNLELRMYIYYENPDEAMTYNSYYGFNKKQLKGRKDEKAS